MLSDDDRVRLRHMLDAAQSAVRFTGGHCREDLDTDEMLSFALLRALEIIGEADAHVSQAARDALPQLAWREIVGMRHRLIHGYFDVDLDRVWDTVTHSVPDLLEQLEAIPEADAQFPGRTGGSPNRMRHDRPD